MTKYYKYPRTPHLPASGGATDDDRTLTKKELYDSPLVKGEIVVSEKLDGEHSRLYPDYYHARSIDSRHHPSRDWAKGKWGQIRHLIPEGYSISCENLFAVHTIKYTDLSSFLLVFAIWDENQNCLDFDQTKEWCDLLGLVHVPILYRGPWDEEYLRGLADDLDPETQEGYVVRTAEGFHYDDFQNHVAKYVSSEFKEMLEDNDEHWMSKEVVPNKLKEDE